MKSKKFKFSDYTSVSYDANTINNCYGKNYSQNRKINNTNNYAFRNQGPVYLFTNENISGYMPKLGDMNGARVLSVCASGDHVFEALLAGASHVDTFDINEYQNCVMELKMRMIQYLRYEEFMDFFFSINHFFDYRIFAPIEHTFSPQLQDFMEQYAKRGRTMFHYYGSHGPAYDVFQLSYLADPNKYYRLRELLPEKINFTRCDIYDIPKIIPEKYDVILLSNIMDYTSLPAAHYITNEVFLHFYHKILVGLSHKNLVRQNGRICFQYIWDVKERKYWNDFLACFQREQLLSHHSLEGIPIKSIYNSGKNDMVMVLRQAQNQK